MKIKSFFGKKAIFAGACPTIRVNSPKCDHKRGSMLREFAFGISTFCVGI